MSIAPAAARAVCDVCNGQGNVAAGVACPVCEGTGMATAAAVAAWRARVIDVALAAIRVRLEQAGVDAAAGWLREHAQSRQEAQQAARTATLAAEQAQAHATAPLAAAAAAQARAESAADRAELAAAALSAAVGQLPPAAAAPDPTDPPPGIPALPAGMGGELFYFDSILVRQCDVWGVLQVAGGGGLMTNPMTAAGDLIDGGTAGTPQRVAVGANGQVLTVVGGLPAWANSAAGFSNPMTTAGDVITGGAAGAAQRLGIGAAGQVLSVVSGAPAWANSPAGFGNPMTAPGDLIRGAIGGTAVRLGAGTNGQVLTVSAGVPAWANNPAGFTNPMTAAGDLIDGGPGGAAIRLPIGTPGQVLQVNAAGSAPVWTPPNGVPLAGPSSTQQTVWLEPNGDILVIPLSTYSLGGDDAAWINTAFTTYCPTEVDNDTGQTYIVGTVRLIGTIYSIQSQVTKPPAANLVGTAGTWLSVTGNITGVWSHFPATAGTAQHSTKGGKVANMVIDGTNAGASGIGLDIGDGWGHKVENIWVQNFTGANGIGLSIANRQFYTEKLTVRNCSIINNTTGVMHWAPVGGNSQEYNYLEYFIWVLPNQNGVVIQGVTLNGQWYMNGNIKKGEGLNSLITFQDAGGNAGQYHGLANISVETNTGTGSNLVAAFMTFTAADQVFFGTGYIRFTGGSVVGAVPGNIQWRGMVNAGNNSFQAVTTPAYVAGSPIANNQNDALVCVAGGTVSAILVNGTNTGQTSGTFFVPTGGTIQVNSTVNPTVYTWISLL
jgi:hypothetical protein